MGAIKMGTLQSGHTPYRKRAVSCGQFGSGPVLVTILHKIWIFRGTNKKAHYRLFPKFTEWCHL